MESESILQYLRDIVETDNISNMTKLASLSILNKIFLKEQGNSLQTKCLQSEFTSCLLTMLDSGLNGLSDPSEAVTISVAMEILCQFSKLPVDTIQCLVTETTVRTLLDYLNSCSKFYQFPASTKMILSEICEGKQLMGKVKVISMATEPLEYIHRHTKHKLKRVPDKIKVCKLIDTEHKEDLDICEYLLMKQVAWPGSFPGEVVSESDEWENLIVTEVLDGGMFWAQVGENAIKNVFDIQRQLNMCEDHVRRSSALIGDTIVVYGEVMGNKCFLRAQVLSFDGCSVEVFAIDYGYTLRVLDRNIFYLPDNLDTKKVKRNVSLCSVDGISAPPYDEELAHNAAAILVNLCKQSFLAGEILEKLDGIEIIRRFLLHCLQPRLKAQVMTILLNLAVNNKLNSQISNGGFVKILLDIIESYTKRGMANVTALESDSTSRLLVDSDEKLLLARTVLCLTNILYWKVDTRATFYKHQGIDIIQELMICLSKLEPTYTFCVKLLKVFLGRSVFKNMTDNHGHVRKEAEKQLTGGQNSSQKMDSHGSQIQESAENSLKNLTDSDSDWDEEKPENNAKSLSGSPVMVDMDESQGYYLGQTVSVYDDEHHELCTQRYAQNINVHTFAKHVCGMLNTGQGGSIFFGIDENSKVFGLELSRDEKDQFRLGVDQHMFDKISPVLLHSQFSIRDYPVIDQNTEQVIQDHYVIEINVRGSRGTIYTMVNGSCYYRLGSDTFAITRQALRQLIIFEEEENYLLVLEKLKRQKEKVLCDLQMDS